MHKIDHSTATESNEFTGGDPTNSVPATVVTPEWLNDLQNEVTNVIEGTGLTLVKGTQNQLLAAIRKLREDETNVFSMANNVTDQPITGLLFDPATIKSVSIDWDLHRKDDSTEVVAAGRVTFHWKPSAQQWVQLVSDETAEADTGFNFGMSVGVDDVLQVLYSADEYTGANYEGKLRYKVKRFTV